MKKLLVILSLIAMTTAFAAPCKNNTAVASQTAQTIKVLSTAPEFTIRVNSNPTTGYSWSVKKYDLQLLTLVSNQFFPPNSNCIGASGYESWTFKANSTAFIQPISTLIEMKYARSWDKQGGNVTKFTVVTQP